MKVAKLWLFSIEDILLLQVEMLKTGGGDNRKHNIFSSQDEKILGLLQEKYFCVDNVLDSNFSMENNSETELFTTPSTSRNFQSCDESLSRPLKTNIGQLNDNDVNDGFTFTYNDNSDETIEIVLEEEPREEQSHVETNVKKKIRNKKSTNEKLNCYGETIFKRSSLSAKKFEVYENKIKVLQLVQKNEEETLKGVKIDNEVKQIIKKKELLNLEIIKIQHERLLENKDLN